MKEADTMRRRPSRTHAMLFFSRTRAARSPGQCYSKDDGLQHIQPLERRRGSVLLASGMMLSASSCCSAAVISSALARLV